MHRIYSVFVVLLSWLFVSSALAQTNARESSALAVLQNVGRGFEGVQDFVVTIEANVDMERLRVPKMTATMYFKKPDKVHFTSANFVMLPREGIVLNPAVLLERYNPAMAGDEIFEGKKLTKLELKAKEPKVRPSKLQLWVDASTWTISRLETVPYQGRVLRLAFTYALQAGSHWLPQTMKASFEVMARDTLQRQFDLDMPAPQFEEMRQRPSRSGSITVKYLDYKVNVGLSDEIFQRREDAPKTK